MVETAGTKSDSNYLDISRERGEYLEVLVPGIGMVTRRIAVGPLGALKLIAVLGECFCLAG